MTKPYRGSAFLQRLGMSPGAATLDYNQLQNQSFINSMPEGIKVDMLRSDFNITTESNHFVHVIPSRDGNEMH